MSAMSACNITGVVMSVAADMSTLRHDRRFYGQPGRLIVLIPLPDTADNCKMIRPNTVIKIRVNIISNPPPNINESIYITLLLI